MAGNGKRLRDAVAETLMVEPALSQAELELHSCAPERERARMRARLQELLLDAPARPDGDGLAGTGLEPDVVECLRSAFEDSLASNATLADIELHALQDLGLEKLGEFRTAIRGHLSGEAELADRDLAIYVKAGEGRRSAFQRALEENLKDLGERPPFERTPPAAGRPAVDEPSTPMAAGSGPLAPIGQERLEAPEKHAGGTDPSETDRPQVMSLRMGSAAEGSEPRATAGADGQAEIDRVPRMEPIPLLTAALEAVGFAEDEFGFVLRYGSYAQPGRSSEFLVGGVGMSDLSERLAGWLEAQGAHDCEVQVLDDGSGELMIYLLGHDRPIAAPELNDGQE